MKPLSRFHNRNVKIRLLSVTATLIIVWGGFWLYRETFAIWNLQITDRLATWRSAGHTSAAADASPIKLVDANFYFARSYHARVIGNLADMKASAQVIDFIFTEEADPAEDNALIRATAAAGNVYYGMSFASDPDPSASETTAGKAAAGYLEATKWPVKIDGDPRRLPAGTRPSITYVGLASASKGLGVINLKPDPDGILRRVPLLVRHRHGFYPSLPFRVLCDHLKVSPDQVIVKPGKAIILKTAATGNPEDTTDIVIPTDSHGNMLLNFASVPAQSMHYSFSRIFQASEKPSDMARLKKELYQKIVFLSETVDKPFAVRSATGVSRLPAATVYSAAIQNILTGSFLKPIPGGVAALIRAALLVLLFLLSGRLSSVPLTVGAFSMATGYVLTGAFLLSFTGTVFQFVQTLFLLFTGLLSFLIGMAIEKAMVFTETEKARRIAEHELEIGRQIQSGFFPTTLPAITGWELEIFFQAARHVAGDFYDVFTMGRKKRIAIVVADICDKGVGAALFMALFRSFIRVLSGQAVTENHLDDDRDPMEMLAQTVGSINNYISITHERDGMFATLFFCLLDPDTGDLFYINGGHEPPMVIAQGAIRSRISPTGPAVGLFPELHHTVEKTRLEPGDTLLVLTDGVIDARDRAHQAFTKSRLEIACKEPFSTAAGLTDRIRHRLNAHIAGTEQFDDITVLALKRNH